MGNLILKGLPVWKKGEENSLNSICAFYVRFCRMPDSKLYITASNLYRAYLNGQLLSYGPARAAHGYFRVDEIALEHLEEENILFIEVAGYNTMGYYTLCRSAFLQAEIRSGNVPFVWTGRDFAVRTYTERVRKVSRFSYQRNFMECYRFYENPEKTYVLSDGASISDAVTVKSGELLKRQVNYPKYREKKSVNTEFGAFSVGNVSAEGNRMLFLESLKTFRKEELEYDPASYVRRCRYCKRLRRNHGEIKEGEYAVFDLGAAETGFLKLDVQANVYSEIMLVFDELDMNGIQGKPAEIRFDRNDCVNIVQYVLHNSGRYVHATFEPYTARYVKVLVKSGAVSELKVSLISYENPDTECFYFRCHDRKLEAIVGAAARTFRHNAVDILTDCPSRERAGWLCDSYFSARAEKLFTGKNLVEKNFLENYIDMPRLPEIPDGMIPMCYPADFVGESYIPNWALWYIVELYDAFLRTGDKTIAEQSRRRVDGILGFLKEYENEYGLLENLEGWVFIEWSKANDEDFIKGVNYPSNMLYSYALSLAGALYEKEEWRKKSEKIKIEILKQSFNGEFFEDNRIRENGKLVSRGHTSETCQYYAFFCRIATPETHAKLFSVLVNDFGAGRDEHKTYPKVYKSNAFIGNFLRLIVLSQNGRKQLLAEECIGYFYSMAERTGTLWEKDEPTASLDHGFASYAANLIVDYMTGFNGCFGNELVFSSPASSVDCELHVPVGDRLLVYRRENGREHFSVPEGYTVKRV